MASLTEDLDRLERELTALHAESENSKIKASLKRVNDAIEQASKAFSGSWLGYHSCVYYENLETPPPGARFSSQWGLMDRFSNDSTGNWVQCDQHKIFEMLKKQAGKPDLDSIATTAHEIADKAREHREELLSIIDACLSRKADDYLTKMKKQAEEVVRLSVQDWITHYRPSGQFMSNDHTAILAGPQVPPHVNVKAILDSIDNLFTMPHRLSLIAKRVSSHLSKMEKSRGIASKQGNKVFIGHGGSATWRELKDFLEDQLDLEVDEFNRKPIAGFTNVARLSEMLEDAAIAFLVMTAEDEQKDGKMHARMNVIHEAGLFQGRLGFARAIIVLEEGCEAFSNVQGLGQIRFPPKKLKAAFQEIREVLERENLVQS